VVGAVHCWLGNMVQHITSLLPKHLPLSFLHCILNCIDTVSYASTRFSGVSSDYEVSIAPLA